MSAVDELDGVIARPETRPFAQVRKGYTFFAEGEKILAATVQVAWIPALQKDSRVRSTHSSTAIEGNPLTIEQVRALEEGKELPAVAERSKREVLNYFAGLRFIEKNVKKNPLTHRAKT